MKEDRFGYRLKRLTEDKQLIPLYLETFGKDKESLTK